MAKVKYLEDYIPYLKSLYPFVTEEALLEMMEDSFDIVRKTLVKPRDIIISSKKSSLFEDDNLYGAFIISSIFDKKYRGMIISRIKKQREKNEEINKQ